MATPILSMDGGHGEVDIGESRNTFDIKSEDKKPETMEKHVHMHSSVRNVERTTSYGRRRRIGAKKLMPMVKESNASSYTLAEDRSQFSRDIDRWLGINQVSTENASVQPSRAPMVQRSTLARSSTMGPSGLWYVIALVLPIFSLRTCPHVRCTTGLVLQGGEMLFHHLSRACSKVRRCVRALAQDHVVRELFATAMDIVLVIYALGFLVLSLYQASIFG